MFCFSLDKLELYMLDSLNTNLSKFQERILKIIYYTLSIRNREFEFSKIKFFNVHGCKLQRDGFNCGVFLENFFLNDSFEIMFDGLKERDKFNKLLNTELVRKETPKTFCNSDFKSDKLILRTFKNTSHIPSSIKYKNFFKKIW